MYKPTCGITPEGIPSIGLSSLAALVFAALGWWFPALLAFGLAFFSCHFFRDPERVTPQEPQCAISPADGKVIDITTKADPFTGETRTYIAIFMNVFSVHVNRSPLRCTVTDIAYHPGLYLNAAFDKSATENERCAYQLRDEEGKLWSMVQIAGLIARRIVCRTAIGQDMVRGERYGMIKFGSRVDMYLPGGYSPSVTIGQNVFAGQTIIARKTQNDTTS